MTAPTASSALVNVAEDAELRLVRLMADPSSPSASTIRPSFVQDCEACIARADAAQLMKTIVAEKGAILALLALDDVGEAVSAISLLAALLDRAKESGAAGSSSSIGTRLLTDVSDSIVAASNAETAAKAVALLATLYNMRSDPTEKVRLLVQMIRLTTASAPSMLEANASVLGKWMEPTRLVAILDEWAVPPAGRRDLYRAAAEGVKINPGTSVASKQQQQQQFTLLLVATYSASDVDAAGLESAKQAAIGAVRDPVSLFVQQRTILSLPAIQALGQNNNGKDVSKNRDEVETKERWPWSWCIDMLCMLLLSCLSVGGNGGAIVRWRSLLLFSPVLH